jgi:sporulation protein YlmC with PRC-barrel domain
MLLSELLRCEVVTESGERVGRVHDVRAVFAGGRLRVGGVVAGGLGLLERYGVRSAERSGPPGPKAHEHPLIPWGAVVRVEAGKIVVREDA